MQKQLPIHEWLAVFCFISILLALGSFSLFRGDPIVFDHDDQIQVRVTGEVGHPGYHFIPRGSTLYDLLSVIQPHPDTEPVKISLDEVLEDGQSIRFKSTLVKVHVKGAVTDPVILNLKIGTQLRDAIDQVELDLDADLSKVQYREIKRNNQSITIPRRKKC